jgi:hypothetical protein
MELLSQSCSDKFLTCQVSLMKGVPVTPQDKGLLIPGAVQIWHKDNLRECSFLLKPETITQAWDQ